MPGNAFLIGQLIASLGLDSTEFNAGMNSAIGQMEAADLAMKKASVSIQTQMKAMGTSMQATGRMLNRYLTLPILAIGAASFKAEKDFESSMSKIEGLVGVAHDEVERLSKAVLELSPNVARGPEELADALFFVESAGLRGADAMDVLDKAAKASVAGLGETKTVADLVTSAMNAYGKENLNASEATDVLVAAVREGKAEADALAGAMGIVIPLSSEMGVKFDQVGAVFAGMTRTGTNARVAATQLKSILSSIKGPTEDAKAAMKDMGLSAQGLRDKIRKDGLISTLELLRTTTDKYGEEMVSRVFPNIRAMVGMLDLMGANMKENIAISERMSDSTGSLDKAFEAATRTTQYKWDKAISQVKTTFVEFGTVLKDAVIPVIDKFAGWVKSLSDRLGDMTEEEKKSTIQHIALAAALGPALTIAGKFVKLMSSAKGPYLAAAVAIAAIVKGISNLVKAHREAVEGVDAVGKANEKVDEQYSKQRTEIQSLVAQIENENISNKGRIEAITKLKEIMPGYTGTLTDEGELIEHNKDKITEYLDKLKEKIRLQVYESEYVDLLKKQVEAQDDLDDAIEATRVAREKYVAAGSKDEQYTVGLTGQMQKQMTVEKAGLELTTEALAQKQKVADDLKLSIEQLEVKMRELNITFGETPTTPGGGGGGGKEPKTLGMPEIQVVQEWTETAGEYWDTYYDLVDSNQKTMMENAKAYQDQIEKYMLRSLERMMAAEDKALKEKISRVQAYAKIGHDVADALASAITGQEGAWKSMVSTMLSGIDRIIQGLLAEAIAAYFTSKVAIPGGLIAAAAGVPILLALWNNLVPSFAEGAMAYGPIVGQIGEYPGASTNPEVIAPLSNLKDELFGSGGSTKTIVLEADGTTLRKVLTLEELLRMTY